MRSGSLARRLSLMIVVIIAAVVFLGLVALSPLALRLLASTLGLNWHVLSDVGQTYGAVSALVTALALGGVVASLLYQARDVSAARSQAIRTFQFELLRLELDDPDLMWASGAPWAMMIPLDYKSLRQHVFVHMWLSFWEDQFLLNEMSASAARLAARELFHGAPAREYWRQARDSRLSSSQGRRLRFLRLMDEEYENALSAPPAVPPTNADNATDNSGACISFGRPGVAVAAVACFAATAGLLVGRLVCRRGEDGGYAHMGLGPGSGADPMCCGPVIGGTQGEREHGSRLSQVIGAGGTTVTCGSRALELRGIGKRALSLVPGTRIALALGNGERV